jgi:peptide/nickel transport system substrate-binding protein
MWELSCWNGGWVYEYYPTGEAIFKSKASCNWGGFSDPVVDELIERTVQTDDLEALYEYQERVAVSVPVLWMPNIPLRLMEVVHNLRRWQPINPFALINPENWHRVE